jgi:two-component system, cell cycle response regulator
MDDSEIKTRVTLSPASPRIPDQGQQCLVLIHPPGPNLGRRYVLDRNFINLGRESSNDIVLDKDSVSRRHARIATKNGERVIMDLGSTNGTYVNDRQITEHRLVAGDQLKVGNSILKYLSGQDVEQAYHEEIYKLTIIDGLTEISNKRYFTESIERELARAKRYARELSLIMFDIDHFKQINDTFGHLAGDQILKDLARIVKGRIRSEETVARYGGEEFAILVPETTHEGAIALAEQLRQIVEANRFSFEGEIIAVTISLGVASLSGAQFEVNEFIKLSDERLYTAKRSGRNRVVGATAPSSPPSV